MNFLAHFCLYFGLDIVEYVGHYTEASVCCTVFVARMLDSFPFWVDWTKKSKIYLWYTVHGPRLCLA